MGAYCCKGDTTVRNIKHNEERTLSIMFRKLDSDKRGYISTNNMKELLRDDRLNIGEKEAEYIMGKYGTDGKMSQEQFKVWWRSTSTMFNDDSMIQIVNEAEAENSRRRSRLLSWQRMDSIRGASGDVSDDPMSKIPRS